LARRDSDLFLFLEMRAGADGYQVAPMTVEAYCPQVLRELLSRRTWTVGTTPVGTTPIRWHGEDAARRFMAVIRHHERNLPVIAISQHLGQPLTTTLPEEVARDLSGLVIVAHLDDRAGWEITKAMGKEWSCYDGAIRIYWPIRSTSRRAFDHPLWTRAKLIASAETDGAAASRIRNQLRRRLLELSTYTVDEPRQMFTIRGDAAREHFEHLRMAAAESGDQGKLAEEYFNRCATLEGTISAKEEENQRLRNQVESLNLAWRYRQIGGEEEIAPEPDSPVTTVLEAILRAKSENPAELVFGDDVEYGSTTLAADAGPPEKIYDYLTTLADMTRRRRASPLGTDMILWLKGRGLKASSESDTTLNSASEMRKRTWHDGRAKRPFEQHLKPSEGTSPDRCVRIYFDYDEEKTKTVVGWVGRHP
jgi:hypothetical protein